MMLAVALTGAARADVFRILDDPRDAAQARVDLIQQADSEIHALYFLARNDRITLTALALLRDARRRGVPSVRLIVDANFMRIPKAVLAHLRDEGVEVRVYHPVSVRHPSWLVRRMHEKVVIVDGERYITGGRNLAEAYFGMARRKNYVDRDVYVEGASAGDADQHFETLWSSEHVSRLKVHVSKRESASAEELLDRVLFELSCGNGFVKLDTGTDWSHEQRAVAEVDFLHDPVDAAEGERVAYRLAEIIEGATTSIVIESPYLVPPKPLLALLEKKLKEGVYVQIVTNSLRSTDGVLPQAGYLKYRRRLARAGIDVREYKGPAPLHAKSAVVDGRVALIGSYNIDPRSQNLNTEVMCVVEDEALAQELLDSIDLHLQNAWRIHGNGRPARVERYPNVSHAKKVRAWLARFLLPIVENQL
ncbi:MAG TPA: phosphatidylserine/phosphatidylglycerophosphate/cardiolipin synthase family protein [Thermoanaerobaculia bacterium]|jgi:phosphatidylserine/phosphatidylglycerophosphate/cardiolipin synthase-like enzyme|nr:phosphatidylserine/phosphatidylglycerophosphate/cardiolipin synthase family protein [Thermoanaerobaculia bacterium]